MASLCTKRWNYCIGVRSSGKDITWRKALLYHCIINQSNQPYLSLLQIIKGGIISKIRRRLTVQGDSENIDGAAQPPVGLQRPVKEPETTEDVRFFSVIVCSSALSCCTNG